MIKKILPFLLILLVVLTAAGAVSSAKPASTTDLGTLTVTFACGCTDSADGYRTGGGAIHYDIGPHNHPVVSAVLTFDDGTTVTWNKINGLKNACLPAGYWVANWHWVYTPSSVLTISDAIGLCPICPCY